MGVWKGAQLGEYVLHKHEDLSFDCQHPGRCQGVGVLYFQVTTVLGRVGI